MTLQNLQSDINFNDIYKKDGGDGVAIAQRLGLIRSNYNGPKCQRQYCTQPPMTLIDDDSLPDGRRWYCNGILQKPRTTKRRCLYSQMVRHNTLFANSTLPLWKILEILLLWVERFPVRSMAWILDVRLNTAIHWVSFCRETIFRGVILYGEKLGGPGLTIEFHESKLCKYYRGPEIDSAWAFGGLEQETGRMFVIPVAYRSSAFLKPIIKYCIEPGSLIVSDCWREYGCLKDSDFQHFILDHGISCIIPETRTHANDSESSWRHPRRIQKYYGQCVHWNLACFIFWNSCRIQKKEMLAEFCQLAYQMYDGRKKSDQQTPRIAEYDILQEKIKQIVAANQQTSGNEAAGDRGDDATAKSLTFNGSGLGDMEDHYAEEDEERLPI